MQRTPLLRLGLAALAAALCTAGLAAPAYADPDTPSLAGQLSNHALQPIAAATVAVYAGTDETELTSTETDAAGHFSVPDLAAGDVKILFSYPGGERWAGGATQYADAHVFTIAAGATTTVDETMPAPALQGRLTTHTGGPAADATVTVYDKDDYNVLADTVTDQAGNFEVLDLAPGKIKVEFTFHSFVVWSGGADEYDTAKVLTVAAHATATLEQKLSPLGILAGRLVDQHGAAVPSTRIVTEDQDFTENSTDIDTDGDGRWSIAVEPGSYTVDAELPGGRQWVPGVRDEEQAAWFAVADGATITVDDTLLPTGTISGRLIDTLGKAVPDADVALHHEDYSINAVQTDEHGEFTFAYVFPGSYTMRFDSAKGPAQWAYGQSTRAAATPIAVTADQVTTVNDKLLGLGKVAGQFTTSKGAPIAKASVVVSPVAEDSDVQEFTAKTDAKGRYTVTGLLPGTYKVAFTDRTGRTQYAKGSGNRAGGRAFTVVSGKTTAVNDTQVAPATLRVTAVDATTGKALTTFCVGVSSKDGTDCTKKSVVIVKNLPADSLQVQVSPPSRSNYLGQWELPATTRVGKTTTVKARLQLGGRISTSVVNRSTGKPVKDICFAAVEPGQGGLPDGPGECSNAAGTSRTDLLAPGVYNLFVYGHGSLGSQWAGVAGGTGDQRAAAKITVRAGKVVAAPKVKLDQGGSISGTVTAADGKSVRYGDASISAWDYHVGPAGGGDINRLGHYQLDGLGPYAWPLVFTGDHGRQWSGGKGNRYAATTVQVTAGKSVAHDEVFRTQPQLTGTVRLRKGTLADGTLSAYDVSTGDATGTAWFEADGKYTMSVPGGERVAIGYDVDSTSSGYLSGWYDHASTPAKATIVEVPATGSKTLNVTIG